MICLYMHGMGSQAETGIRALSGLDRMTCAQYVDL